MKKNIKILAITFSVVLNIVFIGSYFYHGPGMSLLNGRKSKCNHPLYEELNLSHRQLSRLEQLGDSFHTFVNQQGRRIKARQLELVDLLAREKPDSRAIDAKQKEIQALQRQMQDNVIEHLLEEGMIFTQKQRLKFFALIKERIEKNYGPRPRWMPRTQVRHSEGECP